MIPHKIKITPKEEFGLYDIEMDDVKVENISKISIDMDASRKLPKVQIELVAMKLEVELPQADVAMKQVSHGQR